MPHFFRGWSFRIAGLMIPLLLTVGCAASTPTPPIASPFAGDFTAVEVSGKVIHADQSEDVLEKDGNTSVQANDQIQLDETGQGLLQFQDRLKVRMFRSTELHVTEVDEQPSGSTFVSLFQSYGNLHLQLTEDKMVRVVLKTDYATLTTLVDGTDFVVCHTPEKITCGVVNEGAVEFQAQGERVIATKGEAIYVRPEEPPSHAICARHDDVRDWLNKIQGTGEFIGLGAIVQGWSQEPCGSVQAAPTLQGAPLPNREGMVKVEAGLYEIGRPQADDFHIASQEIMLAEFWIDLYEVTNAQYQAFMDGTSHSPPAVWPGIQDHPVKGVTWDQAVSYCAWVNKRLPTEAEWEVAARGPGPNPPLYPWGNDSTAGGQINNLPLDETYPVGAYPFNKSPFGIYDMAGNVWEWVREPYASLTENNLIVRGGRHGLIRDSAYRQEVASNQDLFSSNTGFRCAADRVEGE
jgi:formylglycine-generating enzyme